MLTGGREAGKRMIDQHYKADTCKVYEDFRTMLDQEDIDAVQISTPDHWHAYHTIYCARRGIHCYTQKPFGNGSQKGSQRGSQKGDQLSVGDLGWPRGSGKHFVALPRRSRRDPRCSKWKISNSFDEWY